MKVSVSTDKQPKKHNFEGILPLVDENEPKQLKKGTYSTFHLRTDPTVTTSPTYDFVVPYLYADSTVRQAVQFKKKINRVLTGLNVLTAHGKKNVIEQMLKDSLQALYNGAIRREIDRQYQERLDAAADDAARARVLRPTVDNAMLNLGWHAVMGYLAPPKALSRVKRYLRRHCRKPKDMTVRQYFTRLTEINDEEIPQLPPFTGAAQKLQPDEIVDILCHGCPSSWNKELTRQGKDPVDMTVYQILEFFENQEQTEDFHLVENKNDKKNSSNNNNKSKNKRKSDSDDSSKYCMLHGKGSHSTDECKTLKSEAKRLKDGKSKGDSKNKTWKRKDDKKEINVAEATKKEVTKQVQAAMKELNVLQSKAKKRRIVDDDDESTEENNNVEMDPALFNYADIEEKLKISSDNEDEVTDELSV
jgi:hypothetical protein